MRRSIHRRGGARARPRRPRGCGDRRPSTGNRRSRETRGTAPLSTPSLPDVDAERAYERLETLLARRARPRRGGESPRAYLRAIGADERAYRVAEIRERARYGRGVSEAAADEAVSIVDSMVRERVWWSSRND
ncbi:DUF4129 domain-containing protein [Haloarculaceae archaeon H-GB11]|nr:DUF4129 domain-containing protein [Haloarculaceae archaeon H-GB11]